MHNLQDRLLNNLKSGATKYNQSDPSSLKKMTVIYSFERQLLLNTIKMHNRCKNPLYGPIIYLSD